MLVVSAVSITREATSMYQLHIANRQTSSWSLRAWWLMTVLDIPFEETLTPFCDDGSLGPDFLLIVPTGKVPCLVDGAVTVWESLAIVEYLAERHSGVWPTDAVARAWARCVSAEMHAGFQALRQLCPMHCALRLRLKQPSADLDRNLARIDEIFAQGLQQFGGPFLCGSSPCAADAFYAPLVLRLQSYGLTLSATAERYVAHLLQNDALQQWQRLAMAEPWREAALEADIMERCEILVDAREDNSAS
ncbi:glutathione S-transferase family protein [Halomonas cupida]|nr:glutathione S-transferase family protein [Halomonas cupida]